jgi:tRNA modification GTPase
MNFLDSSDPIIACSSGGNTNTGIAVIRLSGFTDFKTLNSFFSIDLKKIKPRFAHYCRIVDGVNTIDEIVLTFFKGPKSFNGENILELSVHGNVFNVQSIIELFCDKSDFRKAHPGEFSYRALRNKKLSLTQVEGLDLFLNASNPLSLKQGQSLLNGSLQKSYEELLTNFKRHKSAIELSIDFLDDIGEEESSKQVIDSLNLLINSVDTLKSRVLNSGASLISPDIVLIGQPNAGKSSLFNKLLKNNRAIVSDVAGTTRDFISEKIKISNNFYNLVDTAGLRLTTDRIEEEGIKRAYAVLDKAFYKILLINPFEYDKDFFNNLDVKNFDTILFTHSDRDSFEVLASSIANDLDIPGPIEPLSTFENGPIGAKFDDGPIEPLFNFKSGPIGASLISQHSLTEDTIFDRINDKYLYISNKEPIIIDRHIDTINIIYDKLVNYSVLHENTEDISILSSEFNIIGHCISELIGIVSPDEVLHNIFENFCIGK